MIQIENVIFDMENDRGMWKKLKERYAAVLRQMELYKARFCTPEMEKSLKGLEEAQKELDSHYLEKIGEDSDPSGMNGSKVNLKILKNRIKTKKFFQIFAVKKFLKVKINEK